jgi:trimeric autotransporter adhesin
MTGRSVSSRNQGSQISEGGILMKLRIGCVLAGLLSLVLSMAGQTAGSGSSLSSQVPPLIQFSNVASDEGGSSLSGVVSITFSLYTSQQGGAALWTETQNNVQLDPTGHYSVQLGITKPNGVPTTLFTTGEARWLGVRIAEQGEQPRVLLLSVPYALKAGDAETIGGLPPSAFVLAAPLNPAASSYGVEPTTAAQGAPSSGDVTGTGKVGYLPLWDSTSDIISSVLFQKGTGSTAKVGINTATPATTLDVKGAGTVRGTLSLPANGTATATAGKDSQPLNLAASAFNSTSSTAVNQVFQWMAEPVGNDTSTPSGTLNLLFGEGATKPSETGLNIASNGQITFATGQTFPGTGDGTVTGVNTATGSGLTGGGSSGTLNLGLITSCATNQVLQWSGTAWVCFSAGAGTVTSVASGLGLKGGPITTSGTLTIDTTVVPQLAAANIFTANQTFTGEISAGTGSGSTAGVLGESLATSGQTFGVGGFTSSPGGYGVEGLDVASSGGTAGYFQVNTATATILQGNNGSTAEFRVDSAGDVIAAGAVSGSGFQIGGQLFDYGSYTNGNEFLGFGGNTTMSGGSNIAVGVGSFGYNTSGVGNTAMGDNSLFNNCSTLVGAVCSGILGSFNTAVGLGAMYNNSYGYDNTGIGVNAGNTLDGSTSAGILDTSLGYNAVQSTGGLNNATAIGANAVVAESNALVLGAVSGSNNGTSVNVGIGTTTPGATLEVDGPNQIDVLIQAPESGVGAGLDLNTTGTGGLHWEILDTGSASGQGANKLNIRNVNSSTDILTILADGHVGIGTTSADNTLTVNGSADKPSGGSWGTYSDARLKTVNGGFTDGLSQLMKIQPIHYRYKPGNAMGIRDTDEHIGVVAQDVQKVIPEAVTQNSKGYLLVNNDPIIWTMLNAIKEQQAEVEHEQAASRQQQAELAKALRLIKQQQTLLRVQSAAMKGLQAEVRETRDILRQVKAQVSAAQPAWVAAK